MLVLAVGRNLSPVDAVAVAINPADVIFGFKDEDSPLIDGETINLKQVGGGENFGSGKLSITTR